MSNDRRSSTIPKPSEEEKKIKKKAEAMLAKSENNWNKITPDQKETLNSPTTAHFFCMSQSEFKELLKSRTGEGLDDLASRHSIEFCKGKLFVNAADPNNLSWAKASKASKPRREIEKVNLLNLSQNFSGSRDSLSKEGRKLKSVNSKNLEDYDQEYEICNYNNEVSDYYIREGSEAGKILEFIGDTDESIEVNNLVLISTDAFLLFILFRNAKLTDEWLVSLKILLKAQNLSYRGTKDEYPVKKKDLIKEIMKDKDLRLEAKDNNILLWIIDLEVDSYLYRELKIYLWNRIKENYIFIVVDMRKSIFNTKELIDAKLKNENFLLRELVKTYLSEIEISRFFLILQEEYDVATESKAMNFAKEQKDKFISVDHKAFWYTRRLIRKRFKNMVLKQNYKVTDGKVIESSVNGDEEEKKKIKKKKRRNKGNVENKKPGIEEKYDVKCTNCRKVFDKLLKTVEKEENSVLQALKILQMQKQVIRSKLITISVYRDLERNKFRKKRGGKAMKARANKTTEKAAKKAYTAASNVLKIMMFEDTIPGLIPEQIRSTINQEDKKRDGCCSLF